jgi:hypothetical protein
MLPSPGDELPAELRRTELAIRTMTFGQHAAAAGAHEVDPAGGLASSIDLFSCRRAWLDLQIVHITCFTARTVTLARNILVVILVSKHASPPVPAGGSQADICASGARCTINRQPARRAFLATSRSVLNPPSPSVSPSANPRCS